MFRLFFGSPGCGKTTTAVQMIYKDRRKKKPLYDYHFANFKCTIARECSLQGLGDWTFPENSYLAVDEAGVVFNNRRWEKMSQELIEWMKEHRHYGVDVDFFSQSWDDCDATIRRLVDEVWHLKRLGPFTLCRRIKKKVDVDENSHQPMDMYYKLKMIRRFLPFPFNDLSFRLVFRPLYYRYFDTFERKELPVRIFGSRLPDDKLPSHVVTLFKKIKSVFMKTARPLERPEVEENSTEQSREVETTTVSDISDILNF